MEQQRIPVVKAIKIVTGKRIHLAIATRWCTKGRGGHRLQSWPGKKGRVTTVRAVRKFLAGAR